MGDRSDPRVAMMDAAPNPQRSRIRAPEMSPIWRRDDPNQQSVTQVARAQEAPAVAPSRRRNDRRQPGSNQASQQGGAVALDRALTRTILKCSVPYDDWSDEVEDHYAAARSRKTELLQELGELASHSLFPASAINELTNMLFINIDRPLPVRVGAFDPDEDDPLVDEGWIHIHLCYELFVALLDLREFTAANAPRIGPREAILLCELMNSELAVDREHVKTITHRIYSKYVPLRALLRREMGDIFVNYIHESIPHNGLSALLEILGSIINGYVVPLKREHVVFLFQKLLPLYKGKDLARYAAALTYCVTEYITKDPALTRKVVVKLGRYVPRGDSQRLLVFIQEYDTLIAAVDPSQFGNIVKPVSQVLERLIRSEHFQVAERALAVFHNQSVITMVSKYEDQALPTIFPALSYNTTSHWHHGIATLSRNMLSAFNDINPSLYKKCQADHDHQRLVGAQERRSRWKMIEEMAAENAEEGRGSTDMLDEGEEWTESRRQHTSGATQLLDREVQRKKPSKPKRQASAQGMNREAAEAAAKASLKAAKEDERQGHLDTLQETGKTPALSRHVLDLKDLKLSSNPRDSR